MDIGAAGIEVARVVFGFLLLLFLPGFNLSLIFFPRSSSLSIIDRLVYSTVLSISSVIALVLFMDVVLGVNTTPRNITIFICVFSEVVLMVWWCERWYLNSRLKKRIEPRLSADYKALQRFYSREAHAAKDRFRPDTRTVVVYHESGQSGLNHVDHSYLMDIGDEIAIQQVAENKLKVTDSVILDPPYQKTRYFELAIREYREEGLSLIDDLQIYPVLVSKRPDRKLFGRIVVQRGTVHIAERIYKKTSTAEIQWLYSHDFHIFAIIHAEDTLDQMVNLILGKLDEIAEAARSGIHLPSHAEERETLKEEFDALIEKPRERTARPSVSPQPTGAWPGSEPEGPVRAHEVPASSEPPGVPEWPVIPAGVEPAGTVHAPEAVAVSEPRKVRKWPVFPKEPEPAEPLSAPEARMSSKPRTIPQRPVIEPVIEAAETAEPPTAETDNEPIQIPARPVVQPAVTRRELYGSRKHSPAENKKRALRSPDQDPGPGVRPKDTPERPVIHTGVELPEKEKMRETRPRILPGDLKKHAETLPASERGERERRPVVQPDTGPQQTPESSPVIGSGGETPEIPGHPKILSDIESQQPQKSTVIRTASEPQKVFRPAEIQPETGTGQAQKSPLTPPRIPHQEPVKRPAPWPEPGLRQTLPKPETLHRVMTTDIFKKAGESPGTKSVGIQQKPDNRPRNQPRDESRESISPEPQAQPEGEPLVKDRRELQKEIVRGLDVFGLTPESFSKTQKNIEHIEIPKKSDVDKKLAEIAEDKDIDWWDLSWLYEEG